MQVIPGVGKNFIHGSNECQRRAPRAGYKKRTSGQEAESGQTAVHIMIHSNGTSETMEHLLHVDKVEK